MLSCASLDPLVTPFIDDQLPPADRDAVAAHLRACAPCHSRVAAERAVRDLIRERKPALDRECAPDLLRSKCADLARLKPRAADADVPVGPGVRRATANRSVPGFSRAATESSGASSSSWAARLRPLALAASLVLVVGGAFVYQLTAYSTRVMAAELTADHVKCFAMNAALGTKSTAPAVESAMLDGFGWRVHLPETPSRAGLELVGSRPCLYGEGKIAHVMYKHNGRPVSLFMLPNATRSRDFVEVLGHEAAVWCVGNRTFVLVAREPRQEVERMASFVQASLR